MTWIQCPLCGQQAISFARKMRLGPAIAAKCRSCGKKAGVPWHAMVVIIPFAAAIIASDFVESIALKSLLWIVGFLLSSIIHIVWVPLIPR